MAIYSCHLQSLNRAKGHSLAAALAYRTGARVEDAQGVVHDYTRKAGRVMAAISYAPLADDATRIDHRLAETLWRAAEAAETRRNSTLARELVVALPHELSVAGQKACLDAFARWLATEHQVGVTAALHKADRHGDARNIHAHVLFATRKTRFDIQSGAFSLHEKTRSLDVSSSSGALVDAMRVRWATEVNKALEREALEAHVDHRSRRSRGLDAEPMRHVGKRAAALERRGLRTAAGDHNRAVARLRQTARDLAAAEARLAAARARAKAAAVRPYEDVIARAKRAVVEKKAASGAVPIEMPRPDPITLAKIATAQKKAAEAAQTPRPAPTVSPAPRPVFAPPAQLPTRPAPAIERPTVAPPAAPTQADREAGLRRRIEALPDAHLRAAACDTVISVQRGETPRPHRLPATLMTEILAVAVAASKEFVAWARQVRFEVSRALTRPAPARFRDRGRGLD